MKLAGGPKLAGACTLVEWARLLSRSEGQAHIVEPHRVPAHALALVRGCLEAC